MSESILFTCSAQVYQVDKQSQGWVPMTQSIVPVSYVLDTQTNATRISSVDGDRVCLNSTIVSGMAFRKPSETFGQWVDSATRQLFGLNFTSLEDADRFEHEFLEALKRKPITVAPAPAPAPAAPTSVRAEKPVAASGADTSALDAKIRDLEGRLRQSEATSRDLESRLVATEARLVQAENSVVDAESKVLNAEHAAGSAEARCRDLEQRLRDAEAKLKQAEQDAAQHAVNANASAEADRLRAALAQNSANANLWKKQVESLTQANEKLNTRLGLVHGIYEQLGEVLKRE